MIISLIAAVANNNGIGFNNQLLWRLPNDLKFFKNTTWASPVIMGRKTFESLGGKPLPGRLNIVVSRNKNLQYSQAIVAPSLDGALQTAKEHQYNEVFVIGGGELYRQAFKHAQKIYITKVDALLEADTFFPEIDERLWYQVYAENHVADAKHAYNYSFQLWKRK